MVEEIGLQEKYKKLALLGRGATAQVFLVEEPAGELRYAMKVCENRELLRMEAQMLEHVTREAGDRRYFPAFVAYLETENALVMEYLEGQNLQALLDCGVRFEAAEVLWMIRDVLQALEVLHEHGMIYRDLKPANIMLCRDGHVRLIDLGAACYEGAKAEFDTDRSNTQKKCLRAGTYGYAAPEQFWEGILPDKTCDIYSAGKVLAYLVSGKNPAEPPYDMEHYCKGLRKVSSELMDVIIRSLSFNPAGRYADCKQMRRALELAYDRMLKRRGVYRGRRRDIIYEKCIWKSEYRRIF